MELLDRNGSQFVKDDLLAILSALTPERAKSYMDRSGQLTAEDLRRMIRAIVYDPARMVKSLQDTSKVNMASIASSSVGSVKTLAESNQIIKHKDINRNPINLNSFLDGTA